jgi:hypothetical protein
MDMRFETVIIIITKKLNKFCKQTLYIETLKFLTETIHIHITRSRQIRVPKFISCTQTRTTTHHIIALHSAIGQNHPSINLQLL